MNISMDVGTPLLFVLAVVAYLDPSTISLILYGAGAWVGLVGLAVGAVLGVTGLAAYAVDEPVWPFLIGMLSPVFCVADSFVGIAMLWQAHPLWGVA